MHEVTLKFTVRDANNDDGAVYMAVNYLCGGDYYHLVSQHETEVKELPDGQEFEATET